MIKMDKDDYENKGKEEETPKKYTPPVISFRHRGLTRLFEPDVCSLKFDLLSRRE